MDGFCFAWSTNVVRCSACDHVCSILLAGLGSCHAVRGAQLVKVQRKRHQAEKRVRTAHSPRPLALFTHVIPTVSFLSLLASPPLRHCSLSPTSRSRSPPRPPFNWTKSPQRPAPAQTDLKISATTICLRYGCGVMAKTHFPFVYGCLPAL